MSDCKWVKRFVFLFCVRAGGGLKSETAEAGDLYVFSKQVLFTHRVNLDLLSLTIFSFNMY